MSRRLWPCFFLVFAIPAATAVQPFTTHLRQAVLGEHEHLFWKTPVRASEFNEVPHVSAWALCKDTQPPEALATPNPLVVPAVKVKVSFIIGADGRVHSPLILRSGGPVGDRNILQTVRSWRYRPATCNGVPTEAEGKIEFSRR